MTGVTMGELIELVNYGHDAEFTYHDKTYVLQPEENAKGKFLVIWAISPTSERICNHAVPAEGDIPLEVIARVLNEKCFDGKSFLDIESQVTVEVIY